MSERSAVIRYKNSYVFCREAIGGGYYNPVAYFTDKSPLKSLRGGPQEERIIIWFGFNKWMVTSRGADEDGVKAVVFECRNRAAAESMVKK